LSGVGLSAALLTVAEMGKDPWGGRDRVILLLLVVGRMDGVYRGMGDDDAEFRQYSNNYDYVLAY
jgi:hypothetical protein